MTFFPIVLLQTLVAPWLSGCDFSGRELGTQVEKGVSINKEEKFWPKQGEKLLYLEYFQCIEDFGLLEDLCV